MKDIPMFDPSSRQLVVALRRVHCDEEMKVLDFPDIPRHVDRVTTKEEREATANRLRRRAC